MIKTQLTAAVQSNFDIATPPVGRKMMHFFNLDDSGKVEMYYAELMDAGSFGNVYGTALSSDYNQVGVLSQSITSHGLCSCMTWSRKPPVQA
jgi:hypothetical protein